MRRAWKTRLAKLLLFLLCVANISHAEVMDLIQPMPLVETALVVQYTPDEGESQTYQVPLQAELEGTWLWLQVMDDVPLVPLALSYIPAEVGIVQLPQTLLRITEEMGMLEPIDVNALDFTQSIVDPLAFSVVQIETGETLWTGWLTVAHSARPEDLPPTPDQTLPPITPTQEPTTRPTSAPTTSPTQAPTQAPTIPPTFPPTTGPIITPPTQTNGYGLIIANNVNLRSEPNGTVRTRLHSGEAVYITDARFDAGNTLWYQVMVLSTGATGYVHNGYARFMTDREIQEYLNRPTPKPTVKPTATPGFMTGYARTTWFSTSLRNGPGNAAALLKTLPSGSVMYITSQAMDNSGTLWVAGRVDGTFGYIMSSSIVMMSPEEVADYLAGQQSTPTPTAAPTLNPNYNYVIVKMDNVNFRSAPDGSTLRRVDRGTMAQLLLDNPVLVGGHGWYYVQIDKVKGYLREDMVSFVQITPTASPSPSPSPSPTPSPSPSPTPEPLPSRTPMTFAQRIRAVVDGARLAAFGREQQSASAYVIADYDGNGMVELVLFSLVEVGGSYMLQGTAYGMQKGTPMPIAEMKIDPVLAMGTELDVIAATKDGLEMICVHQRDMFTGKAMSDDAFVLGDKGWQAVTMPAGTTETVLFAAKADLFGEIWQEDYTGLHADAGEAERAEQEAMDLSAIMQVFLQLISGMVQGNG